MTIPRTYLGVDPGSTTGLAVLRLTGDGYIAAHDQVAGPHDASYWIREHCEGQFIELVYAFGDERGVVWSEPEQ